jgi:hypothetical protein
VLSDLRGVLCRKHVGIHYTMRSASACYPIAPCWWIYQLPLPRVLPLPSPSVDETALSIRELVVARPELSILESWKIFLDDRSKDWTVHASFNDAMAASEEMVRFRERRYRRGSSALESTLEGGRT